MVNERYERLVMQKLKREGLRRPGQSVENALERALREFMPPSEAVQTAIDYLGLAAAGNQRVCDYLAKPEARNYL